jgi:hypothetical protein
MIDAGRPPVDIFIVAAQATAGGVWTAAWLPERALVNAAATPSGGWDRFAYLTAGFIDVDPSLLSAEQPRGRLVGFDGHNTFATLCTADIPLRAVVGVDGHVFAAGDGGGLVDYNAQTRECARTPPIDSNVLIHAGAEGGGLVYWVGQTAERGALYRQTASGLVEESATSGATIPPLLALSYDPVVGFWAVGEQGTILHLSPGGSDWRLETMPAVSAALRGVSSETGSVKKWTMAVGGGDGPGVLAWNNLDQMWQVRSVDGLIADQLYGIHLQSDHEVYFVGANGFTAVFNGGTYYLPPQRLTSDDLLFVTGREGLYIAGGGTPADRTAAQHGVLLIRGASQPEFLLDGESYSSFGRTRLDFGGGLVVQ